MEYNLNVSEVVIRLVIMMAIIIVSFFAGVSWLSLLALPIFLSALLGWCPIKSRRGIHQKKEAMGGKSIQMQQQPQQLEKAA